MLLELLLTAWLFFSLGFFFSMTDSGRSISYALLAKLDEVLPKKSQMVKDSRVVKDE